MLRAENKEDRIWFTKEQRSQIFKENYKVCACCGKKLTLKTMTMEHIIPLNRGGKNERENLCCLCYDCNQRKGNTFYLPFGYYLAIAESPRFGQILDYVAEWYKSLPEGEKIDLRRYPLITPAVLSIARFDNAGFEGHRKKTNVKVLPTMTFKWELVGNSLYDEVEAVTGQSVREMRSYVCHDMAGLDASDNNAGVYLLRKVSTDKLMALVSVRYCEEKNAFFLYIPWTDAPRNILAATVVQFAVQLVKVLTLIAEKEVNFYVVDSPNLDALNGFYGQKFEECRKEDSADHVNYGIFQDMEGNVLMHRMEIMRNSFEDLICGARVRKGGKLDG